MLRVSPLIKPVVPPGMSCLPYFYPFSEIQDKVHSILSFVHLANIFVPGIPKTLEILTRFL
jgi:hypothetical protein